MASEDLLKKAVAAFNALSPEQQAEMLEEQRQSWARGNIGLSQDERGMTSPVMPSPAPAATDTGLVTYAHDNGTLSGLSRNEHGPWCLRSQAEELLAAERARADANFDKVIEQAKRAEKAEADNVAQAARIKAETELRKDYLLSVSDTVAQQLQNQIVTLTLQKEALEAKLAAAEKALELIDKAVSEGRFIRIRKIARAVLGGKP